jgi:hypothetical protein
MSTVKARVDKILKDYIPGISKSLREVTPGKYKFNVPSIGSTNIKGLGKIAAITPIEIKRSGTGVVVIIDL